MVCNGVCAIQECVLSRSVCYPGVCTIQECELSRSVYYPGVCTIHNYAISHIPRGAQLGAISYTSSEISSEILNLVQS